MNGTGEHGRVERLPVEKIKMTLKMRLKPELRQRSPFWYGYTFTANQLQFDSARGKSLGSYSFTETCADMTPDTRIGRWYETFSDSRFKMFLANVVTKSYAYFIYIEIFLFPIYAVTATAVFSSLQHQAMLPVILCSVAMIASAVLTGRAMTIISNMHSKLRDDSHSFVPPCSFYIDGSIRTPSQLVHRNDIADKLTFAVRESERKFEELTGRKGILKNLRASAKCFEKEPKLFALYSVLIPAYIALYTVACVFYARHISSVGGIFTPADIAVVTTFVVAAIAIIPAIATAYILREHLKIWNSDSPDKTCDGHFEFYLPEGQENRPKNTRKEGSKETNNAQYRAKNGEAVSSTMRNTTIDIGLENVPVLPTLKRRV